MTSLHGLHQPCHSCSPEPQQSQAPLSFDPDALPEFAAEILRQHPSFQDKQFLMVPLDFFIMEEFIFPEEGGVTSTVEIACPHCESVWDLEVDSGNTDDGFRCRECNGEFSVDWVERRVA